jgi:hypothetical protein
MGLPAMQNLMLDRSGSLSSLSLSKLEYFFDKPISISEYGRVILRSLASIQRAMHKSHLVGGCNPSDKY